MFQSSAEFPLRMWFVAGEDEHGVPMRYTMQGRTMDEALAALPEQPYRIRNVVEMPAGVRVGKSLHVDGSEAR